VVCCSFYKPKPEGLKTPAEKAIRAKKSKSAPSTPITPATPILILDEAVENGKKDDDEAVENGKGNDNEDKAKDDEAKDDEAKDDEAKDDEAKDDEVKDEVKNEVKVNRILRMKNMKKKLILKEEDIEAPEKTVEKYVPTEEEVVFIQDVSSKPRETIQLEIDRCEFVASSLKKFLL
jgi:hypothetical protein